MEAKTSVEDQARFKSLMRAGSESLAVGDRQTAHERWREAAIIDPYSEKVWLALLRVLDTDEDRRVCLENIIAINPMNVQARRQLRAHSPDVELFPAEFEALESMTQPKKSGAKAKSKTRATSQVRSIGGQKRGFSGRRLVMYVVVAFVVGVLVALLLSVLIFGR